LAKNRKFFSTSLSHLAPSFEVKSFTVPEPRVFQTADSEDLVILACTVFDWSIYVTDGQTDRRTNGQG